MTPLKIILQPSKVVFLSGTILKPRLFVLTIFWDDVINSHHGFGSKIVIDKNSQV